MLLSIYYFIKELKTMNKEPQHTTLKYLSRHADPEHFSIVQKCREEVMYPRGKNLVRRTGFMPPHLSRKLLKRYTILEGNQGN